VGSDARHVTDSPSTRRRSVCAVLVVALLGVTAGCFGGASPTPTTTPTATPTATVNTDCPPSLTVYEIDREPVDPDAAVAYATLTAEQRETFHRARNESVEDFDYAWHDVDVVVYEGRYYRAGILVC